MKAKTEDKTILICLDELRTQCFNKFFVGIEELKKKDPQVNLFMSELISFYTTTDMGLSMLLLLFFPPSKSLETKETLGNRTGTELHQEGVFPVSVVELFPYAHERKSKYFDQEMFKQLMKRNKAFRMIVLDQLKNQLLLETYAYFENHKEIYPGRKRALYVGGEAPRKALEQIFDYKKNTRYDLFVQSEHHNILYAVHPSYYLSNERCCR